MRRYQLAVNNTSYEIDVDEISASQFVVHINDRQVEVELISQQDAADAQIVPQVDVSSAVGFQGHSTASAPKVPASIRKSVAGSPSPAVAGGSSLAYSMSAPMPGVILEVKVAPGDLVAKGDTVMILEAMKMKNELHASRAGTIEEVLVSNGDQVKYSQLLLRFAKD